MKGNTYRIPIEIRRVEVQRAGTTKIFVNLLEDLNNTRVLYQTWF
jgi:hypothetical protein